MPFLAESPPEKATTPIIEGLALIGKVFSFYFIHTVKN
jgi:hypothetical protein